MSTWVKFGQIEEESEDRFWFVALKSKPVEEGYVLLCKENLTTEQMTGVMKNYRILAELVKEKKND